jgi:UDP-N-acetylmuramoyl-L-alanyl-D-glutamate--2,6-diaminopimelate ligase
MAETNMQQILDFIAAHAPGAKLASDSRRIKAGDVFFAYPGDAGDGRAFIAKAVAQGAAAVLYDGAGYEWPAALTVPHMAVAELKKNAGAIAHAVNGMPDSAMFTVGVTGTNGKTSCAMGALLSVMSDIGSEATTRPMRAMIR